MMPKMSWGGGEHGEPETPPKRPCVLVVDDEPNIRTMVLGALDTAGYELVEAADGEGAEALLREHAVDLVVSDLVMPGIPGTELLARARAVDETIGFILLTGLGKMEDAISALRLQADDYVQKPFDPSQLRLAVRRALRHTEVVRENRFYQKNLETLVAAQARQIEKLTIEALQTLANAVETRDGYTGGYIERVTRYAMSTGSRMGLDEAALRELWMGGLLHDIGKIGIPDQILNKAGPLDPEEYEIMKQHPEIGAAIMERSDLLRPGLPGVLHHHERWDGRGYPRGLGGTEIPASGRILAVVDTYDAITTTRPYRAQRSNDLAIAELRRCSSSQFDADVVEAFLDGLEFDSDPPEPDRTLPSLAPIAVRG